MWRGLPMDPYSALDLTIEDQQIQTLLFFLQELAYVIKTICPKFPLLICRFSYYFLFHKPVKLIEKYYVEIDQI
jgi:hypothetical protein